MQATSNNKTYWLGLPNHLLWGFIAIALFMSGDGFEMAFLSKHMVDLGFSSSESATVIAVYGFAAAIAAWASGVVAEIITPQKAMSIGCLLWIVMHVLFLVLGLDFKNYFFMLLFYGIRGLAYPLFIYSFMLLLVQNLPSQRLAAATGWFWAMYSIGIGVVGSYLPSFTIPWIGETGTLWFAVLWVFSGGLVAYFSLKNVEVDRSKTSLSLKEKCSELTKAITILGTNKNIFYACIIRTINTISLFGFPVIMPIYLTSIGYSMSEWLQIWTVFFFTTIFSNILWGITGEYIGWIRQVRWFGCIGMMLSTLIFFYLPYFYGYHFYLMFIPAILLGTFVAAFVPMTAVFPALEPKHKGAAISIYNLSAGLSNFVGPAIASIVLIYFDTSVVVWIYAALYLLAFVLTYIIKVPQILKKKWES